MKRYKKIDLTLIILASLSLSGLLGLIVSPYMTELYLEYFPPSKPFFKIYHAPRPVQFLYEMYKISLPTLIISTFLLFVMLLIKFSLLLEKKLDQKDQKILEARKFKN